MNRFCQVCVEAVGWLGAVAGAEEAAPVWVERFELTLPERLVEPTGRARVTQGHFEIALKADLSRVKEDAKVFLRVSEVRDSKGNDFLLPQSRGREDYSYRLGKEINRTVYCNGIPQGAYVFFGGNLELQMGSGAVELPEVVVPANGSAAVEWEGRKMVFHLEHVYSGFWILRAEASGGSVLLKEVAVATPEDDFVEIKASDVDEDEAEDNGGSLMRWMLEEDDGLEALKVNVTAYAHVERAVTPFRFRLSLPEVQPWDLGEKK